MPCRTGCRTKDHRSYGHCLRAARIEQGGMDSRSVVLTKELNEYAAARADGIQPASTRGADTRAAVAASDRVGAAFDATTGTFKG